jgi:hypothetical protein
MYDTGTIAILSTVGVIGLVTIVGLVSGAMEGKKIHNEKEKATSMGGSRRTHRKHHARRNGTRRA